MSTIVAYSARKQSPEQPSALVDRDEVRRALQALTLPGQVIELRILNARTAESPRYAYQASGYFNDAELLNSITPTTVVLALFARMSHAKEAFQ